MAQKTSQRRHFSKMKSLKISPLDIEFRKPSTVQDEEEEKKFIFSLA